MNIKNFFFILSAMLVRSTCFAGDRRNFVKFEDLIYLFYAGCGISVSAIILCMISYYSGSKALNIIAWVAAILSIITSLVLTHTNYSMLSAIIPSLCLMILLTKMEKSRTGIGFFVIYLLKSIACLVVFFNACKMILEISMTNFLAIHTYFYQLFLVLLFNIIIVFLVYNLLKELQKRKISFQGIFHPILWSIIIGIDAYFIDIIYMIIFSHSQGYHIDISFLLLHIPYLNIFTNLFCWAVTGMIVHLLYSSLHKRFKEAYLIGY